jgi:hypothetical protein
MAGRRAHDVGALRWLGRLVVRLSRGEGRRRRGQGRGATFSAEQMRAPRHWSDRPEYGGNELLFPRTAKRQQLLSVSTFAVSCMYARPSAPRSGRGWGAAAGGDGDEPYNRVGRWINI